MKLMKYDLLFPIINDRIPLCYIIFIVKEQKKKKKKERMMGIGCFTYFLLLEAARCARALKP